VGGPGSTRGTSASGGEICDQIPEVEFRQMESLGQITPKDFDRSGDDRSRNNERAQDCCDQLGDVFVAMLQMMMVIVVIVAGMVVSCAPRRRGRRSVGRREG